jgi:hypothetical protein
VLCRWCAACVAPFIVLVPIEAAGLRRPLVP